MNLRPDDHYIGDGVYVRHDEYGQLWLMTERADGLHRIALDPHVFKELVAFAKTRDFFKDVV